MISNYNQPVDGHLAGINQATLAEATHKLGGNFDGPIYNFGF